MAATKSNDYAALAEALIDNQKQVFGQQAEQVADNVSGISVTGGSVSITGDGKQVVSSLVDEYADMFGKSAASSLRIAASNADVDVELPENLQI